MAIDDVYDALVSRRVYKRAFTHAETTQIIREGSGKHFDPVVVEAFLALSDTFRSIHSRYQDHDPAA